MVGTDALDTYALDLAQIVDAFTYELCEECGMDLDAHVIVPFLGHPLVRCLMEPELEPPTDEACPEGVPVGHRTSFTCRTIPLMVCFCAVGARRLSPAAGHPDGSSRWT